MRRASRWINGAALGLALACAFEPAAYAQTQLTPVRFRLDWVWQAPQSIWTLAYERKYFQDEGLDVTIDRGYGGPDTIGSVASGAYDIGFSDVNGLVEFNAKNPDHKVKAVFIAYDATLGAIITRKGNGINTPKDLRAASSARRSPPADARCSRPSQRPTASTRARSPGRPSAFNCKISNSRRGGSMRWQAMPPRRFSI